VDRMSRCGDMAIRNYQRWRPAVNLDLMSPEIAPFDPLTLKTLPSRTKHEVYRITCCGDKAIRVSWGHMEPHFGRRGGRTGSAMAPFERAMVVSYRLSIVTVTLSVIIRPQFAIECLRRSNQQGWVILGQHFRVFPLE